jgi:hypothetical protein
MKLNMGITDRRIRAFIVAPVLLVLAWLAGFATIAGIVALGLAVVMVGTAAVGSCPLYLPLHLNTDHHANRAS